MFDFQQPLHAACTIHVVLEMKTISPVAMVQVGYVLWCGCFVIFMSLGAYSPRSCK